MANRYEDISLFITPLSAIVPFLTPLNAVASSLNSMIQRVGSSVAYTRLALPSYNSSLRVMLDLPVQSRLYCSSTHGSPCPCCPPLPPGVVSPPQAVPRPAHPPVPRSATPAELRSLHRRYRPSPLERRPASAR